MLACGGLLLGVMLVLGGGVVVFATVVSAACDGVVDVVTFAGRAGKGCVLRDSLFSLFRFVGLLTNFRKKNNVPIFMKVA